jgi:acyl-CoA hydrolase
MNKPYKIFVGEGTAEPTTGFTYCRELFQPDPVQFYFGVRRTSEGLQQLENEGIGITANFPGRGMAALSTPLDICNLSTYSVSRVIETGRLQPDAVLLVATPPDSNGVRTVGTANGPIQAAIDQAPLIIVEEYPELPVVAGAATIPADKPVQVIPHQPAEFAALSRAPADIDIACADHIAQLIPDGSAIQLGVGGIIEALAERLTSKKMLRSVSGAVGSAVRKLYKSGCLAPNSEILGSAIVGDDELIHWASDTPRVRLLPSHLIHNPRWIAQIPNFHSVNVALSVDRKGNVNAESIGDRKVSGKGGSPNFSQGAHCSEGGLSIFAFRTDKSNPLVDTIEKPTVRWNHVDCLATEKGTIILKGKNESERAALIESLFL